MSGPSDADEKIVIPRTTRIVVRNRNVLSTFFVELFMRVGCTGVR